MRFLLIAGTILTAATTLDLAAQELPHVLVEATSLVVDESRLRTVGAGGLVIAGADHGVRLGGVGGDVLVGTRVGGVDAAAWVNLARRYRAVERESTQRIVVLSGSSASLTGRKTLTGPYGHEASGGADLRVEPVAVGGNRVLLRIRSAVGEVRPGPFGNLQEEVPIESATEIVVPSGTPVLIADASSDEHEVRRGLLSRSGSTSARRAWIVVTATIVEDLTEAQALPAGVPREWLER
jgi:hypothetical protein